MGFSINIFQPSDFIGKKFFPSHRFTIGNESKVQNMSLFSLQIDGMNESGRNRGA